jgi:hypothetical protein
VEIECSQGDDGAVRAVDQHGIVLGGPLLAQGIAVMPHRPGVGGILGHRDG